MPRSRSTTGDGAGRTPGFPRLRTPRLLLRSLEPADREGYAELLTDPATHPYISDTGPVESDIEQRIARNRRAFREGRHIYWAIELGGEFVGYVAAHEVSSPTPALSYAIRPAWRRQGLAREAVQAVCRHLLGTLRARELVARTHDDNEASVGLLEDLGFREVEPVTTAAGPRREFRLSAG